ncbi:carbonic anhydrase family protein [Actinokineospora sp.]|uniref:carbonic anhydrase family protein n=1 Tax=Actinokineospora sp. TaxID=1872133 RepID=UPI004037C836
MSLTRRSVLAGIPAIAAAAVVLPRLAQAAPAAAIAAPRQSPIDIRTDRVRHPHGVAPLVIDYPTSVELEVEYVSRDNAPAGCAIHGPEETVEASGFSRPAHIRYLGERYDLLRFHFHRRSEHTVDGLHFPLEQHFVHARESDGRILVLGLFLVRGAGAPQDDVLDVLPRECGTPVGLSDVDLRAMLPADLATFRYSGSLTTAPYAEGIDWNVLRGRVGVRATTIDHYRGLFPHGDARQTQRLNHRTVLLSPDNRLA